MARPSAAGAGLTMTKGQEQVIKAWVNGRKKTAGNIVTDGHSIYYHGTELVRKSGAGKFEMRSAGYGGHVSTRSLLNAVFDIMYGSGAPHVVQRAGNLIVLFPDADHPDNAWDVWTEGWMEWS